MTAAICSAPILGAISWLQHPLIEIGDSAVTTPSLLKIAFWFVLVLALDVLARRLLVSRLLRQTQPLNQACAAGALPPRHQPIPLAPPARKLTIPAVDRRGMRPAPI